MSKYDNIIKLAICGGGGVGKTSISLRYLNKKFFDGYDPTIEDIFVIIKKN
jgi:GTPase SAR1 family protein